MKFIIVGSFLFAASVIVEQIIRTLHEEELLTAQLLKRLINSKLKTLHLFFCIPEEERDDTIFYEILTQLYTR